MRDILAIAFLAIVGIAIARLAVLPLIGAIDRVADTLTVASR